VLKFKQCQQRIEMMFDLRWESDVKEFFGIQVEPFSESKDEHEWMYLAQEKIFRFLKPKPSLVPLINIGGDRDGAYLLPDDLDGIKACFSPGVNNFKYFEDELLLRFGIESHLCDFSSDVERLATPLVDGMQTFQKKWLDLPGVKNSITLHDWVCEYSPGNDDLLLQIDIEGAEYRNLLNVNRKTLRRFRVIVMELHGLNYLNKSDVLSTVLQPFFEKMENDFVSLHLHPNNCAPPTMIKPLGLTVPPVLELTLLRKDRLEPKNDTKLFQPLLPHPLDITRNDKSKPPVFLDAKMQDGNQPLSSQVRQLHDEINYANQVLKENVFDLIDCFALLARGQSSLCGSIDLLKTIEIAFGKNYESFGLDNKPSERGVIGRKEPFFFHTPFVRRPRIKVDLGNVRQIIRIKITNRTNGWADRANGLMVILHLASDCDCDNDSAFVMPLTKDFLAGKELEAELLLPGIPSRYITFTTPLRTALHFSDLKIYALPALSEI